MKFDYLKKVVSDIFTFEKGVSFIRNGCILATSFVILGYSLRLSNISIIIEIFTHYQKAIEFLLLAFGVYIFFYGFVGQLMRVYFKFILGPRIKNKHNQLSEREKNVLRFVIARKIVRILSIAIGLGNLKKSDINTDVKTDYTFDEILDEETDFLNLTTRFFCTVLHLLFFLFLIYPDKYILISVLISFYVLGLYVIYRAMYFIFVDPTILKDIANRVQKTKI